jgi:APA family basic amino acid/polyamine antiporter
VSLLGAEALGASSSPLADAVERAFGDAGGSLLSVLALAATGNTVLLLLLSGSRSIYGMARSGALPAVLGRVSHRNTPTIATVVILACVAGFVTLGDIALVARIATLASLLSFTLVNISLVRVLKLESGSWRSALASPISLAQPAFGAAACLWLAIDVGWAALAAAGFLAVVGWTIGSIVHMRTTRGLQAEYVRSSGK